MYKRKKHLKTKYNLCPMCDHETYLIDKDESCTDAYCYTCGYCLVITPTINLSGFVFDRKKSYNSKGIHSKKDIRKRKRIRRKYGIKIPSSIKQRIELTLF